MAAQLVADVTGTAELQANLTALGADMPRVVMRSLNRTRVTVLTRLLRWLSGATGLTQARLRKSMRTVAPTPTRLETSITVYGGRDALIKYGKAVQRDHLPRSAFRRRMPRSGHVGFFERRGDSRHRLRSRGEPFAPHELAIDEVMGPRITDFLTDVGLADVERYAEVTLVANLEREVAFRLSRQIAKAG